MLFIIIIINQDILVLAVIRFVTLIIILIDIIVSRALELLITITLQLIKGIIVILWHFLINSQEFLKDI